MAAIYILMDVCIVSGVVIELAMLIRYIRRFLDKDKVKRKYDVSEFKNYDLYDITDGRMKPFGIGDYHAATDDYSADIKRCAEDELDKL